MMAQLIKLYFRNKTNTSDAAAKRAYPAELQKSEEVICREIEMELESENPQYRTIIKSILRRERYGSHRRNKSKNQEDNK